MRVKEGSVVPAKANVNPFLPLLIEKAPYIVFFFVVYAFYWGTISQATPPAFWFICMMILEAAERGFLAFRIVRLLTA